MIQKVTIFQTLGGRDSVDYFTNEFLIRTSGEVDGDSYEECGEALANALGLISTDRVRIQRVVFSPQPPIGQTKTRRGDHTPVGVDVVGKRELEPGDRAAVIQMVAMFGKNSGRGFGGRAFIRGVYRADEVTAGDDLHVVTVAGFPRAPFDAFAADLPRIFGIIDAEMVLPPLEGDTDEADYRAVRKVLYQGPNLRQRRNSRSSVKEAEQAVARRKMLEVARDYKAALKDAAKDGLIAVAQAVLNVILQSFAAIIRQYGYQLLLRAGIPAPIRVLTTGALQLAGA